MAFRVVIHTGYDYAAYHGVMDEARQLLLDRGLDCEIIPMISDWSAEATIRCTKGFHAALASHEVWDEQVFRALSGTLRFVCKLGTGMDTFDLDAASRYGVRVENTPYANASAVADMTIALMLAVNRNVARFDRLLRNGVWWTAHLGQQLEGATVGLIGFGAIAQIVRRYLTGFNCRVLSYTRSESSRYDPDADVEFVPLKALATQSDFVSVHIPLNQTTMGLIGKEFFENMKSSGLFFNTSRGPIVREQDLIEALQHREIAGAGLDVYESEPLPMDSPLLEMDNVVLTTHVAGNTLPAVRAVAQMAAEKVVDFAAGRDSSE